MTTMKTTLLGCAAVAVALVAAPALTQPDDHKPGPTTAPADQTKEMSDPYLLDVCVVSGEKLGSMGKPIVKMYDGRQIRFCGNGCIKKFEDDSAAYWKKVNEQIVKRQMPFYPLDTCMVTGEELGGEMGVPIDFVHKNRLIRFCCRGCLRDFRQNSNAFIEKLDAAVIASQRERYPPQTCPVSGEALDSMENPVDRVYGNRLVRFCCAGCIKRFEKNPTTYVAAIDKAWTAHHGTHAAHDEHEADHASSHGGGGGHGDHDHGHHDDGGHGG